MIKQIPKAMPALPAPPMDPTRTIRPSKRIIRQQPRLQPPGQGDNLVRVA